MKVESDGIPAGELARMMDIPPNTTSAHLATLTAKSERQSRSIISGRIPKGSAT
jgi:DNA-binding CsgD family transcriptional regulator